MYASECGAKCAGATDIKPGVCKTVRRLLLTAAQPQQLTQGRQPSPAPSATQAGPAAGAPSFANHNCKCGWTFKPVCAVVPECKLPGEQCPTHGRSTRYVPGKE